MLFRSAFSVKDWLQGAFHRGRELPEDAEGYLLGRAMRSVTIERLEMCMWMPPVSPAPEENFRERYGDTGSWMEGWLVCPFWSPRGSLIGFEARNWQGEKKITDYRTTEAAWNPVFIGLTSEAMQKIWDGGDVWIVEGIFDLTAMERVVPEKDVVLATVRAKVSYAHVEFLRRHIRPRAMVHIVYDNDETGRKQTHGWVDEKTGKERWGALKSLDRVGVACRAIPYQGGKDPGEIWDNGGVEAVRSTFAF